jgi:hypothetical protein
MSKKMKIDGITNELAGASLFFKTDSPSSPLISNSTPEKEDKASLRSKHVVTTLPETKVVNENHLQSSTGNDKSKTSETQPEKEINRINEKSNERTFERNTKRYVKRNKIRHTFDIFADQLLSLREISIDEEKLTGERVLIGDLAQQALDMFISKHRNK